MADEDCVIHSKATIRKSKTLRRLWLPKSRMRIKVVFVNSFFIVINRRSYYKEC